MRLIKIAAIFFVVLAVGSVLAQDEVIARAYRTVNVRSGPGTQYDIVGQLNSGNEVPITGRSDDASDWLRISFQGVEGWVAYFTVTVLGATDQLPIVTPMASEVAVPIVPVASPTHALSSTYVTAYRTVNVRSGAGLDYVRIGNLESESAADVTGRTEDSEWLRIDYNGQEGWVAFFVVTLTGVLDDVPVVEPSADAATEVPTPVLLPVVMRYNVNLHEQPALDSGVMDVVPFKATLQADARSDERASWLRVTYNGEVGWLIAALVSVEGNLGDLPIVAPATAVEVP